MPYYSYSELVADSEYIASHYNQLKADDIQFVMESWNEVAKQAITVLKEHNFNYLIEPIKNYCPKTYQYLFNLNLDFRIAVEGYMDWGEKTFRSQSFFTINDRVYWIHLPLVRIKTLPDYINKGWGKYLGGVECTDSRAPIWGRGAINDAFNWLSFDDYLPSRGKKKIIRSLVERIPYVFEEDKKDGDITPRNPKATSGFPNLRCMVDTREPLTDPKEYDLILICYNYNQTVYWVKDGDFEQGLFEIKNPEQALDEYLLHFFSQKVERFDFSPWAKMIEPKSSPTDLNILENEDDEEENNEEESFGIPVNDPELAAKLGNVPNQIRLGLSYSLGLNDFEQNIERGHYWFWQAAKAGNTLAEYNWASYWCANPAYIEDELVVSQLEDMHKKGNLAASYILGSYAEHGLGGIVQSYSKAVEYYQYAADLGFPPAMNNLADKYEKGLGVEQNFMTAYDLYMKAAQYNIAAAQWSLALMYLEGKSVHPNEEKAKEWLELASENGWDAATYTLKNR